MSILQKGTLTVVIATVIASGMIVSTGNTIANDKIEINTKDGVTVFSKQSNIILKREKSVEKTIVKKKDKISLFTVRNSAVAPPPGPFLNEDVVRSAQRALLAPMAPKEPTYLPKKPEQPPKSISLKSMPTLPPVDPEMKSTPSFRQATRPAKMPEFGAVAPVRPENKSKQPEVVSKELPIWMQKRDITKQQKISSKDSTKQHQTKMRKPNMGLNNNYPAQQYIYVPVPMIPSNLRPPQIPVFNRSITPPSADWGLTNVPKKVPTISIKKESTENSKVLIRKDNKE